MRVLRRTIAPRTPAARALVGVLAAIILVLAGIWLGGHPNDLPAPLRGRVFEARPAEPVFQQAMRILKTRYFRPLEASSLVDLGLSGMVAGLDDPYSRYIDRASYQASMHEPAVPVTGIGIDTAPEPQGLRVLSVVEGSPAARGGLMPGDVIVKVDSTSLADRAEDGAKLIRGPEGTTVTLTVLSGETKRTVPLVRAKIVVPAATGRMLSYHGVRVGYLRLTGFSEDSGSELRSETKRLLGDGAQGLILDLRENGGGLISEAINVASIFLAHGTIMSAVERDQPRRVYEAQGNALAPRLPLAVLVDHGTASSSEIVTAALQDHGRATVVGTPTYGKGVFQLTLPLRNGGALDITIGQFFAPNGQNIGDGVHRGAGITPNIEAPESLRDPVDEALATAERTVAAEVR